MGINIYSSTMNQLVVHFNYEQKLENQTKIAKTENYRFNWTYQELKWLNWLCDVQKVSIEQVETWCCYCHCRPDPTLEVSASVAMWGVRHPSVMECFFPAVASLSIGTDVSSQRSNGERGFNYWWSFLSWSQTHNKNHEILKGSYISASTLRKREKQKLSVECKCECWGLKLPRHVTPTTISTTLKVFQWSRYLSWATYKFFIFACKLDGN